MNSKQRRERNKRIAERQKKATAERRAERKRSNRDGSEEYRKRDRERLAKRLAELKAQGKKSFGGYICREKNHWGDDRRIPLEHWNLDRRMCRLCSVRLNKTQESKRYLESVAMARDKLIQAIIDGKLGSGTLKDFYGEALRAFGGVAGLVETIKTEFDAADAGSLIRKQYLEMIVKVMVAISTMGGDEDLETVSDEELANRLLEMRKEATQELLSKDA